MVVLDGRLIPAPRGEQGSRQPREVEGAGVGPGASRSGAWVWGSHWGNERRGPLDPSENLAFRCPSLSFKKLCSGFTHEFSRTWKPNSGLLWEAGDSSCGNHSGTGMEGVPVDTG